MFKKGEIFEIKPSAGFLGIEKGEVQIIRIAKYEDVCEEYADPSVLVEDNPGLKDGNWVVYMYTLNNPVELRRDCYCLDEETFKYHVGNPYID